MTTSSLFILIQALYRTFFRGAILLKESIAINRKHLGNYGEQIYKLAIVFD